jgi:hypothetical protein
MSKRLIPFAIAYDFDGTLAPGNMQECDFIPNIGMTKKNFWDEVNKESIKHKADNILMYMQLMLKKADEKGISVLKKEIMKYGKGLSFFDGILPNKTNQINKDGWFDRINQYGEKSGVKIQHFIISSGIREIVSGTCIAKYFKSIFASSFCYDHNGVAKWPAQALNYTSKTQYLFRINKGCLDVCDHGLINKFVNPNDRAIPFANMIYIGDGETDIPCFKLLKEKGGHSIAVYKPATRGARKRTEQMFSDGRINFLAPADFRNGSSLDQIVKSLIDKVQQDDHINNLSRIICHSTK